MPPALFRRQPMLDSQTLDPMAAVPTEHPALRAWYALLRGKDRFRRAAPAAVDTLKNTKKAGVFRLRGVGLAGAAVIAKRCRRATAQIEYTLHQEVLPGL